MTDTTVDCNAEIKRQIEVADRILWETRGGKSYNWARDYFWLKNERARLIRELSKPPLASTDTAPLRRAVRERDRAGEK
jgi:hypothetical protein